MDLKYKFDEIMVGLSEVELCQMDDEGSDVVFVVDGMVFVVGLLKMFVFDMYMINFMQCVCDGKIDLVIGCEVEICQVIDILMCCCQNNLIMIGEVGVGKMVVVEGFVLWIVVDDVLLLLCGVVLYVFDMGLLQVGVSVKGEFENWLKSVIDEVKKSVYLIILFIDEVYMIIGVGGQVGQNDVVNLLKLVFVCGELCMIVVMMWSEYKKYFEKDVVFVWCFQVVKVEELSELFVVVMLCGMLGLMEKYFNVWIFDDVIIEVVCLLYCYISGCQLLDKVISVFDIVCVKVVFVYSVILVVIDDIKKCIECIDVEIVLFECEVVGGVVYDEWFGELCGVCDMVFE